MREISIIAFLFIAAIGVVGLLLVARDPAKLLEFGVKAPGSGSNLAALSNELLMPSEDEALSKEPVVGGVTAPQPTNPAVEVRATPLGYLNVRDAATTQGKLLGKVLPGTVCEYTEKKNGWYHILVFEKDEQGVWSCQTQVPNVTGKDAWVSGVYVDEVDTGGWPS